MRITIEFTDAEIQEICCVMRETRKGTAIRKLVKEMLMMKHRAALAQKFISGEWGVELKGLEESRAIEVG